MPGERNALSLVVLNKREVAIDGRCPPAGGGSSDAPSVLTPEPVLFDWYRMCCAWGRARDDQNDDAEKGKLEHKLEQLPWAHVHATDKP